MSAFAPFDELAKTLLPHAFSGNDGAHDHAHLIRVWKNAKRIHATEGGDMAVLAAAATPPKCLPKSLSPCLLRLAGKPKSPA